MNHESDPFMNDAAIFNPTGMIDAVPMDKQKIHIRIQQRNGRKSITTIEGLANDLNLAGILKHMKKTFHCNGAVSDVNKIMLFGDQRVTTKKFLIENSIAADSEIVVHGY